MPFEIAFNNFPNIGKIKTYIECDKDGNEFPVKAGLFNSVDKTTFIASEFTPNPPESVARTSQLSDEDEESDNLKEYVNSISIIENY